MDTDSVEALNLATLGGTDTVAVGDLSGTQLRTDNLDLSVGRRAGRAARHRHREWHRRRRPRDGRHRWVGTPGAGLHPLTTITGNDSRDQLHVSTGAGDDSVHVSDEAARADRRHCRSGRRPALARAIRRRRDPRSRGSRRWRQRAVASGPVPCDARSRRRTRRPAARAPVMTSWYCTPRLGLRPMPLGIIDDDQRTEDGVPRLTATTEQRRAADDGGGDREQQDVARHRGRAARHRCSTPGRRRRARPSAELTVNAVTLMWRTSMPARRAASSLPPVANRWRPHGRLRQRERRHDHQRDGDRSPPRAGP